MFYYVYILESLSDGKRYIGFTANLRRRLVEHERGLNFSTKFRRPFKLIYFEACLSEKDAKRREHYLKSTQAQYDNFDNIFWFAFANKLTFLFYISLMLIFKFVYSENIKKQKHRSCSTGQGRKFTGLRLIEYQRQSAFGTRS
ncbi:MAG: GIY-YIG nuclease family protein [Candidatus Doudnabacteria bacterium]|nr:GIY-YIG nuclease family protein [Candidatus Doudnabacteria bacterium]